MYGETIKVPAGEVVQIEVKTWILKPVSGMNSREVGWARRLGRKVRFLEVVAGRKQERKSPTRTLVGQKFELR